MIIDDTVRRMKIFSAVLVAFLSTISPSQACVPNGTWKIEKNAPEAKLLFRSCIAKNKHARSGCYAQIEYRNFSNNRIVIDFAAEEYGGTTAQVTTLPILAGNSHTFTVDTCGGTRFGLTKVQANR